MSTLIDRIKYKVLSREKFLESIKYNKEGYYAHRSSKHNNRTFKVTVIVPIYNAEDTIEKTIDSIISQTLGFEDIELLLVDDLSTDKSREILLDYAEQHDNIVPVFLETNSGSPSVPRNLGIQLARGEYLTFIDSDDWFHEDGIRALYELLKKTGLNYAVGKTIKVTDKGQYLIGEYNSWTTREAVKPLDIPHIFHHLGPTGRMMRTAFLRDHQITFPSYYKFAEDKHFFIDVLVNCPLLATSDAVIYYANRYAANKSLTTTTSIFEKTDTNIALIHYVKKKQLPADLEAAILNRIYEFDCISRLFNRGHFLNSEEKDKYYEKFSEVLATAEDLRYDFTDYFFHDWHRTLVSLFRAGRYDDVVRIIKWFRHVQVKDYKVIENEPYFILPFEEPYHLAKIGQLASRIDSFKDGDSFILRFHIYGVQPEEIDTIVFRERNDELKQLEFPIQRRDGYFEVRLSIEDLIHFEKESYAAFIQYNNYEKIPIRMNARQNIAETEKKFDFYVTVMDNFALNVK